MTATELTSLGHLVGLVALSLIEIPDVTKETAGLGTGLQLEQC